MRLIPARSHAPRDPLQAIHCAVEGMDAKRSAAVLLSSPAAAQRCAEGAGLDSGTVAAAQSAMPSIAAPDAPTANNISTGADGSVALQLQSRISTNLTDVTLCRGNLLCRAQRPEALAEVEIE